MLDRRSMEHELDRVEAAITDIHMAYEKYFMGVERRPPEKNRDALRLTLRRLSNLYIPQVDLRFRYMSLSTRFYSYAANWDRTMRLIEEGKFIRQKKSFYPPPSDNGATTISAPAPRSEVDVILEQLERARLNGQVAVPLPDRQQLAHFLDKQRVALRDKTGGREVEFLVAIEDGKPKIKARPK